MYKSFNTYIDSNFGLDSF